MSILLLKDKNAFSLLLKVFKDKEQITFNINYNNMVLSSLHSPYLHLSISNSLFQINRPIKFTINIKDLLNNIDLLETNVVLLVNYFTFLVVDVELKNTFIEEYFKSNDANTELILESFLLRTTNSFLREECTNIDAKYINFLENSDFISIPFNTFKKSLYYKVSEFSTRCFIEKNDLNYFLEGNVTYSLEESSLIMTKSDEKLKVDVEFLTKRFLSFTCSNNWLPQIKHCLPWINNVLFCFSENILCVKMLFKFFKNTCLEIHIEEKIISEF